jgi:tRNA modification GTPase
MYYLNDTIVAVSSPTSDQRVIIRISGAATVEICKQLFNVPSLTRVDRQTSILTAVQMNLDELKIDTHLYLFFSPHSYTGEDVAEIHLYTNPAVIETLLNKLLRMGPAPGTVRSAGPGEFTARAYLNGKIDLAQAEAVNEIIVSSNKFQLAAAEKLLAGRLAETITKLRENLTDCLSLIEAGLDFSGEEIEFITTEQIIERLTSIKKKLNELLSDNISCESVIDLPSVGIAGAPNAGKSSLLNKLLGKERSIVSEQYKTTRDVLTGVLTMEHCRCVLFDCAGLTVPLASLNGTPKLLSRIKGGTPSLPLLDELAQQAAFEALRNSDVIVFCIDASKDDWAEDISIRQLIHSEIFIPAATKCDLLSKQRLAECLVKLKELFSDEFLFISSKTGAGIELLRKTIEQHLIEQFKTGRTSVTFLTARHKQAVTEAIENVSESINELKAGNDDVTAMMLRAAYQSISGIEQHNIDDEILDRIFSRFCIGK